MQDWGWVTRIVNCALSGASGPCWGKERFLAPYIVHNDGLVAKAAELTGRDERSVLIRLGLEALIERESSRRLALLGGTDPRASAGPRQRIA
ncbi:MAG: type II toxin-antitoxin system VapB family antitoxin [Lacisediminihabitans sp.]